MALPEFLHPCPEGSVLNVKVQPRASKNAIGKPVAAELKIHVTAPPVDSAANEALIELLAEAFDCARNRVEIIRGHQSRHKIVKLHGLAPEAILRGIS
ncbi:MAG: DUF167 domain-containing protein [Verrucomicrobia bacterium]|nr:DUF167 domain-containing protein [Verrucomicrobiota bacterium]MDE3100014.1 DUF167 domain-containing protein [Verrucomicrobiota bacterium]